jgi:multiple sugar transport system permease protein
MALKRTKTQNIFLLFAVTLLLSFSVFPFIQILSTSLKHQVDWGNPSLIPAQINLNAYKELLGLVTTEVELPETIKMMLQSPSISEEQREAIIKKFKSNDNVFPFGRYMLNTFLLSTVTAILSTALATFAAYALSRLSFRGRSAFSNTVMFVYMMGGVLLMVPLYQMAVSVGLAGSATGTMLSLLLIYLVQTLPVAIYMLGNYFRTIPFSLEEAAMIDGYSRTEAIFAVIIPLSRPMLLTVMFYCFVIAWNEYLFASVFLKQYHDFHTLPLALQTLFTSKNAIWDRIMAASMLTLLPVIIAFSIANRFISSGGTDGGVKE